MQSKHVEIAGISKTYGGARALDGVDITIVRGTVHCIVGENGAGKSTLGKIIAGIVRPDGGDVKINGESVRFRAPADALAKGITAIAQEIALVPAMTVADNVLLGVEPTSALGIDRAAQRRIVDEVLALAGFNLDPKAKVQDLRIADQQKVEILKALARDSELIVMDEPTASLATQDADSLLDVLKRLRDQGKTVVYVSHHLDEVLEIADEITVLRNGRVVQTGPAELETRDSLVTAMLGRPVAGRFPSLPPTPPRQRGAVLSLHRLTRDRHFADVSFHVWPGEIVGIAGLVGSGRSELARAIAGADRVTSGSIELSGKRVRFSSPRQAMKAGIYLVPESRKDDGLIMARSTAENITLSSLSDVSKFGWVSERKERDQFTLAAATTDIRASSLTTPVATLSGGNQQKALLARVWLCNPTVLIVDEPTRGVDVGAKFAIHSLLVDIANTGAAVIVISSEHEEVMGLSHRLIVMREGRVVREFDGPGFHDEEVKRAIVAPEIDPVGAWRGEVRS